MTIKERTADFWGREKSSRELLPGTEITFGVQEYGSDVTIIRSLRVESPDSVVVRSSFYQDGSCQGSAAKVISGSAINKAKIRHSRGKRISWSSI